MFQRAGYETMARWWLRSTIRARLIDLSMPFVAVWLACSLVPIAWRAVHVWMITDRSDLVPFLRAHYPQEMALLYRRIKRVKNWKIGILDDGVLRD